MQNYFTNYLLLLLFKNTDYKISLYETPVPKIRAAVRYLLPSLNAGGSIVEATLRTYTRDK